MQDNNGYHLPNHIDKILVAAKLLDTSNIPYKVNFAFAYKKGLSPDPVLKIKHKNLYIDHFAGRYQLYAPKNAIIDSQCANYTLPEIIEFLKTLY